MKAIYMRRNFCCFCCSFQTEIIILNVLSCMVIGYILYGMIAQTFFTKDNLVDMYRDEMKPIDKFEANEVVESLITFYWIVMVIGLLGLFAISLNFMIFIPNNKQVKSERRIFLVPWLVWCIVWFIVIIALQIWIINHFEVDFLKTTEATILQCLLMAWSLISGFSYYHFLKQFSLEKLEKEIIQKPTEFQRTFEKLKDDDTPPSSRRHNPVYNARNNLLTPRKSDLSQQNTKYLVRVPQNDDLFIPSPSRSNDMHILPNGKIPYSMNTSSPYPPLRQNSIPNMVHVKPFIVDKSNRYAAKTNVSPATSANSKGAGNGYLPLNRSYTWAGIYAAQEVPNNTLSKSLPDTTATRKHYRKKRRSSRGNIEFDII